MITIKIIIDLKKSNHSTCHDSRNQQWDDDFK